MSQIRFGHVFAALMLIAALSAFVVRPVFTDPVRASVQSIFAPVIVPVRSVAGPVFRKFESRPLDPESPEKPRAASAVYAENKQLRIELASLSEQLKSLQQINADRANYGRIRELCIPVGVLGADAGSRESLSLRGTSMDGLRTGWKVLYRHGILGRISRVGTGGSQVQLITDKNFKITGAFGRIVENTPGKPEFVRLGTEPRVLVGTGQGQMLIHSLTLEQAKEVGLRNGDWVVLDDPDWPDALMGYRLGRVIAIEPWKRQPLFAEITVAPDQNLMSLGPGDDVMVLKE